MGFDTGGLRLPRPTVANPCLATRSFGGPQVQSPLPALRQVRDRIRQSRFRLYSKEVAPTIEWLDQKGDRTGWVFNRFLSKLPALPLRHSVSTRLLPTLLLSCRNCVAYLAQHFLFPHNSRGQQHSMLGTSSNLGNPGKRTSFKSSPWQDSFSAGHPRATPRAPLPDDSSHSSKKNLPVR